MFLVPGLWLAQQTVHSQSHIEKWDDPYLCNYSKVSEIVPHGKLSVRSAPRLSAPRVDTLVDGQVVYVCDESIYWYKVVYGDTAGHCDQKTEGGSDIRLTKECKTGWIIKKWVDVLSG